MPTLAKEIIDQIGSLPEVEKLKLVDLILTQLDELDPRIDKVWAEESHKRWQAYKERKLDSIPYEQVIAKYQGK